jgi:alpha-tubulin suppressor-like RCC1 family protein
VKKTANLLAVLGMLLGSCPAASGGTRASATPSLTNVVTVAFGNGFSLAVQTGGTVTTWGNNSSGQCNVPRGLSNVVAVAASPSR